MNHDRRVTIVLIWLAVAAGCAAAAELLFLLIRWLAG